MEKRTVLVSVFLTLWKCEELTMQNVTFQNTKQTWKSAANFCSGKGGVLESNVTFLREQNEFKKRDVWLGKFRTLTNWTYIRGCYLINGNFQSFELELSNTAELQCQMLCDKYKFYSIKEADCYCIVNISSFVRSTDCNCVGCYKVWEHQYPDFDNADKHEQCIAAVKCDQRKLIRSSEKCEGINYDVTCDNGVQLRYNFLKYQSAADECARRGSFIKWYPENYCDTHGLQHHYWTSGTRHIETFRLRKAYFTENLQPDECFILKENEKERKVKDCKNKQLPFFCRFETDEDKGDIISIPNHSMPQQKNVQSDDSGSIAAGTVTSIIVVIVVISVLVFIHRRRLSKKKPTLHDSQNNSRLQDTVGLPSNYETSKAPVYHEIDAENFGPHSGKLNCSRAVNNITYDQVNSNKIPKSQNVNQSTNCSILTNLNSLELQKKVGQEEYDMAKVMNVTGDSSEVAMSSDYCLAKPISSNTEEESDPYEINKDYDHLNNVKKKEDPITKVYDHLPTTVTDDPTYDHSHLNSASDNGDYYDHFKNDGDYD
ncbi:uncharacterized protein LOC127732056 isoform X7 [Mytilus californianus]|uniref:uncharacterized protein LOC127732056 isoform X7 n=1 Tax=Mytilus californianus TaxID=6549 RepID=UPI0022469634|nr:uncharacterized protein LOC127732056 isoform X7 [Mytilus californianus]